MKHGWNSLDDYIYQHQRRLEDYPSFIEDYSLEAERIVKIRTPLLIISIEVVCSPGIKLDILKTAELRGKRREEARTKDYSYNASVANKGNILRYDNAHIHPGHFTTHHKHIFDQNGIEIEGSPIPIEDDKWPHMHQVIEELIEQFGYR